MNLNPDTTSETIRYSNKPRMTSSGFIYVGLFLGLFTGIFFGEFASWLQIIGEVFIKLLQITVIPYISLSLIIGIGGLSYKEVAAHAVRGGGIFLLISSITLIIVLLIPLSFPDWLSSSFFSIQQVEGTTKPDFMRLFIPSNPIYSYAFALVPAIVIFSILVGVALIEISNNEVLLEPLKVLHTAMMKITNLIGKLAPIGVFALISSAVGTIALEDLVRLQVYIIVYALIALLLSLYIIPGIITVFTPFKLRHIRKALRTPLITAFATGSSLIVVPMLIQQCRQMIADFSEIADVDMEEAEASIKVLIPAFFTFPSPMALLSISFVLFAGWYIGSDVPASDYFRLILIGVPSLFGGTLLTIPSLLDLLKLPNDLFQLFISIDVIIVRFGTIISVMHYATIGLVGTMALIGHVSLNWARLAWLSIVSSTLIVVILIVVRLLFSTVIVAPYTKSDMLRNLDFLGNSLVAKVYSEAPENLVSTGEPHTFSQIKERGILRACFQPNEFPSSFMNNSEPSQLVGFDIEMAHHLSETLGLSLELLPAETENEARILLDSGVCDIYMRTLAVTPVRSQKFNLTTPVYRSSIGLIVHDYRRNEFRNWDEIRKNNTILRIGVEGSQGNTERINRIIKGGNVFPIGSLEDKIQLLESGAENIDAIIDMAEEAAALTILYPEYSYIVPKPPVFLPVSFAVALGNDELLRVINSWILMTKEEGHIDALYRHWMLGEATETHKLPRWSIVRNVLGWVE